MNGQFESRVILSRAADGSTKYECIEYKKFKIRFNSWDNVEVT